MDPLLNAFQRDFPVVMRPFDAIGRALGMSEAAVLAGFDRHLHDGAISRIGAITRPGTIGASTLAALELPAERLAAAAEAVNAFPEVSHNYERAHRLKETLQNPGGRPPDPISVLCKTAESAVLQTIPNLWFVASARDRARLAELLDAIGAAVGTRPLSMPLVEEYHIDLGFDLGGGGEGGRRLAPRIVEPGNFVGEDRRLLVALQGGLPLVARPFAAIGARIGMTEDEVILRIAALVDCGAIRRFGVIVRHLELGYRANAMVVWNVPDHAARRTGLAIAALAPVRLAYRRERALPAWPYNVYAMVHARSPAELASHLAILRTASEDHPMLLLATGRRFKQSGARFNDG